MDALQWTCDYYYGYVPIIALLTYIIKTYPEGLKSIEIKLKKTSSLVSKKKSTCRHSEKNRRKTTFRGKYQNFELKKIKLYISFPLLRFF